MVIGTSGYDNHLAVTRQALSDIDTLICGELRGKEREEIKKDIDLVEATSEKSRSITSRVRSLFWKSVDYIQRHPKKSLLAFTFTVITTVVAAATVGVVGGLVAYITVPILTAVSLIVVGVAITFFIQQKQREHTYRLINDLKIAEIITAQESIGLKKFFRNPNKYAQTCNEIVDRLHREGKIDKREKGRIVNLLQKKNPALFFRRLNRTFSDTLNSCFTPQKGDLSTAKISPLQSRDKSTIRIKDIAKERIKAFACEQLTTLSTPTKKTCELVEKLGDDLRNDRKRDFKNSLIRYYEDLSAERKKSGDAIESYINDEWAGIVRTLSSSDLFLDWSRFMREEKLYASKLQLLQQIVDKLEEVLKQHVDVNDDSKKIADQVAYTHTLCEKLYQGYGSLLRDYSIDMAPKGYTYSKIFGDFNSRFRMINDMLDLWRARLKGEKPEHKHTLCSTGCHYAYDPDRKEEHAAYGFPVKPYSSGKVLDNQYVNVVRSRFQLNEQIENKSLELVDKLNEFFKNFSVELEEKDESAIAAFTVKCQKKGKDLSPQEKEGKTLRRFKIGYLNKFLAIYDKMLPLPFATYYKSEVSKIDSLREELNRLQSDLQDISIREKSDSPFAVALEKASLKAGRSLPLHKKNVIFFTSSYGSGHKSTVEAVAHYLGKNGAHMSVFDLQADKFASLDPVYGFSKFFGSEYKSTDIFNAILRHQRYGLIRAADNVDAALRKIFHSRRKIFLSQPSPNKDTTTKQQIRERLLMERPDIAVTTYHMDLNPILEVCQELKIPVLHLATDMEVKAWEVFGDKAPDYGRFKVIMPSANPKSVATAKPLKEEQLVIGNIPLRPAFYVDRGSEEVLEIKRQRGIDEDAKVLLVMSGGNGQEVSLPKHLANSEKIKGKYHLIIIAGNNNAFEKKLSKKLHRKGNFLQGLNPNVTIKFARDPATKTDQYPFCVGDFETSKLMDIADAAYLPKGGGITVAELTHKGVPIWFDRRHRWTSWEEFNSDIVLEAGRGIKTNSYKKIEEDLDAVIALGKDDEHKAFPRRDTGQIVVDELVKLLGE